MGFVYRAQYERAVGGCGREWKSDKLWDHYVKWESTISKENVLKLYDRILANQTQGLSHQFDMFREFVKDNAPKDIMSVEMFPDMRKQVLESLVKEAKATEVTLVKQCHITQNVIMIVIMVIMCAGVCGRREPSHQGEYHL